jgi:hypothetical protein
MKKRRQVSAMGCIYPENKNGMVSLQTVYETLDDLGRVLKANGAADVFTADYNNGRVVFAVLSYGLDHVQPKTPKTRKRLQSKKL